MRLIKLTEVKRMRTRNVNTQNMSARNVHKERYFNADKIENFSRLDETTYLFMSTSGCAYEVVETPEEIITLINRALEI